MNYAATIGFFDGVHTGHACLLSQLRTAARERGLQSLAVTFDRHPRSVLQADYQPQLLTPLHRKVELLQAQADRVEVIAFTPELAKLTAREFLQQLCQAIPVDLLMLGYDHRFGSDRLTDFEDYRTIGESLGMEVLRATDRRVGGRPVSSSVIRRALNEGRVELMPELLGREYELEGRVVGGHQLGRQLGFPTANLQPDDKGLLIPKRGVYEVQAVMDGQEYRAMLNIGIRPTLNETDGEQSIEAHLLQFSGDLYGRRMTVRFVSRLRDELHFDSLDQLQAQLQADRQLLLSRTSFEE